MRISLFCNSPMLAAPLRKLKGPAETISQLSLAANCPAVCCPSTGITHCITECASTRQLPWRFIWFHWINKLGELSDMLARNSEFKTSFSKRVKQWTHTCKSNMKHWGQPTVKWWSNVICTMQGQCTEDCSKLKWVRKCFTLQSKCKTSWHGVRFKLWTSVNKMTFWLLKVSDVRFCLVMWVLSSQCTSSEGQKIWSLCCSTKWDVCHGIFVSHICPLHTSKNSTVTMAKHFETQSLGKTFAHTHYGTQCFWILQWCSSIVPLCPTCSWK